MNSKPNIFSLSSMIIPIAIRSSPVYFMVCTFIGILHGSSYVVITYYLQHFLESLEHSFSHNNYQDLFIRFFILGLALVMNQLLSGLHNVVSEDYSTVIIGGISKIVHTHAGKMEPIVFENPDMLNHIKKAEEGINASAQFVFTIVTLVSFYFPYFLFMSYYLYTQKPIMSLFSLIIFIPVTAGQVAKIRLFSRLAHKNAVVDREVSAFKDSIIGRRSLKETRLNGSYEFLVSKLRTSTKKFNDQVEITERESTLIDAITKFLSLTGYAIVLGITITSLRNGQISAGATGAIIASLGRMVNLMEEIISGHVGRLSRSIGSVANLASFLTYTSEQQTGTDKGMSKGIVLDQVTFKYPLCEEAALKDISLIIQPGESVALVGENGSGKTTLSMLMLGLYPPTSGDVFVEGKNTKNFSPADLRNDKSAVYQDYQRYQLKLNENIDMGNKSTDASRLKHSLLLSGLSGKARTLPDKEATLLSREFGGVELSGGEWQRIAVARGFYKQSQIIVLDEPTSAIDPIYEDELYRTFQKHTRKKTSITVTHRLGSVKSVNRILVLEGGRIVENGKHEELLKLDGIYAKLFNAQVRQYG